MDGYLLDTNVACALWDLDNPYHGVAETFLASVGSAPVLVSPVVFGEIIYGYAVWENADEERRAHLLGKLRELPPEKLAAITHHTAREYGQVRAALFRKYGRRDRKGQVKERRPEALVDSTSARELGIQENDLWLAAQAVERSLVLVSRDSKMERIKEVYSVLKLRILESQV